MRIASLSPAVTEILFAMERQREIVCVDKFSDYPDGTEALPHLRDHQKIDIDELKTFSPEVIFTSTLVQQQLAAELRTAGFGVIHQDPRSIHEIYESIREIGAIVGCDRRAHALVESMQQGFNDTKRKAGLFPRKPRVYIEEWHHPPMASGNWVPDVVKIAGGVPFAIRITGMSPRASSGLLFPISKIGESDHCLRRLIHNIQAPRRAEAPQGEGGSNVQELGMKNQESRAGLPTSGHGKNPPSREVSLAEVHTFDPDVIVLSICGAGSVASKELLTSRVGWADLRAVREHHLFVIDDSLLNRPGPRLVQGAKRLYGWMFQVLH